MGTVGVVDGKLDRAGIARCGTQEALARHRRNGERCEACEADPGKPQRDARAARREAGRRVVEDRVRWLREQP